MRYPVSSLLDMVSLPRDQVRRLLGVSGSAWGGYMTNGIRASTAELWAERLGFHPYEVWPELSREHVETVAAVVCARPNCGVEFVPKWDRHKFCCQRCQQNVAKAAYKRRRYASDPEFREAVKEEARARYEAERDYIRFQQAGYRKRRVAS
jgi:hypothetical protein